MVVDKRGNVRGIQSPVRDLGSQPVDIVRGRTAGRFVGQADRTRHANGLARLRRAGYASGR